MGQKVNPNALRLGVLHTWDSRWFSEDKKYFRKTLVEDVRLRRMLHREMQNAGLARVEIERSIRQITITLHVARPGVAIGRGGEELTKLKKEVETFLKKDGGNIKIDIRIEPVKKPDLEARLVAQMISDQIARRMHHKRVVNQAMQRVMNAGAKGVKIVLSGRIGGAEIGRVEKYAMGSVPLTTIREDVQFAIAPSLTKSGYVGVKVWVCRK
ncbi:30S ribosomal protein S3 [Candidatus Roizmanbacteria bacterium RIFCSPLOWO2_01_FULL_40_14]|uniref:Small ribosomal subunit protein uS3 n=4 Tax=root TaxID=1 RepID=A0A0G0ZBM5_9BACT|nr:30S ribosomal protein S3 [uncultured organism]KKR72684.1 MAG: 30S ribosomal protein S3 [Candidatus Roizmanbacteria bacterium GW2011_GWB1_40_7]KKR94559.1 MAG: 30S ribosomal protein S3 [Candidatus Roizmanbacteria bacterium GW2011_GWA1_41_13]KKS19481.1 MAG: 30S ribosomal protein S3 [Candidatus Roizmanbacteria bacterium GW2011_GWC2_41_7]OGK48421.1 MAG: 30S ribosomal protein S3 [Candidatus Roizmanbacteria bacterium RIFCSPLOWO2_01_FULL_40_14]